MDAAKVDYRYLDYPGAVHAFTNPEATEKGKQFNLPLAYHPEADKQSKAEMAKFFSGVFGKK
jgi:dienelactone hydrolase